MKKSPILLMQLFLVIGNLYGQDFEYDAIPNESKQLIFEDQFNDESKGWKYAGSKLKAKVKEGILNLKSKGAAARLYYIDAGLNQSKNYEIEASVEYIKGESGAELNYSISKSNTHARPGFSIAYIQDSKGKEPVAGVGNFISSRGTKYFESRKVTTFKKGFNTLNVLKIEKLLFIYVNKELVLITNYINSGDFVGFQPPWKGESNIDYIKIFEIDDSKTNVAKTGNVYQFATLGKELLETDVMKPETLVSYSLTLKNNGPFNIRNPKFDIREVSGNEGITVELFNKVLDTKVGKEFGATWLFTSSAKLKSGLAKYEVIATDQVNGFEYGPYPVEFKTEGFPPPNLVLNSFRYEGGGSRSVIRGGSVGKFLLDIKNDGVGEALDLKVELNEGSSLRLLSKEVKETIPPNTRKTIQIEISTPLKFDGSSENVKLSLAAKGMEAKAFSKSFQVASFHLNKPKVALSTPLQNYYGYQTEFNYQSLKKGIEATILKGSVKANFWKAIFYLQGDGSYEYDPIKAQELAKEWVNSVYKEAFAGDLEAVTLMGLAFQYGLGVPYNNTLARGYFKLAAEGGFSGAQYHLGLNTYLNYQDRFASDARKGLEEAASKGIDKANYWLGVMNLEGQGFTRNEKEAYRIFKKTADAGDPRSMFMIGSMHLNGTGTEIDTDKAHHYLKKAAEAGISEAMVMLGTFYTTGKYGQSKNKPEAHKWLSKAANQGNVNAMFTYGAYQLSDEHLGQNFAGAHKYLLLAAKQDHGGAMSMLGRIYQEGLGTEVNQVKARFWVNEADRYGEKIQKSGPRFENYAMNIINNMDWNSALFGNTLHGVDQYGRQVEVNTGSDMMGQVLGGVFNSWMSSRVPDPNATNSYEYIMDKDGKKIYAATINGYRSTSIKVKRGQKIKFISSGKVQVGMFAGVTTPRGIGGYRSYNIARDHPHGSFVARVENGEWEYIGGLGTLAADRDGNLEIALNDRDNSNNRGGFDVRIEIE